MKNPMPPDPPPGLARRAIAGTAAVIGTIVWSHALAAPLRALVPGAPTAAGTLTLAAILVALVGIAGWPRKWAAPAAVAAGLAAAMAIDAAQPGALLASLALAPVGGALAWAGGWLASRLPVSLDSLPARRRRSSVAWAVLALVALVQVGRLATYMTDPEFDWYLSTRHPFWAKHECATAYVYAAELNERGETNVYDALHYPGLNPDAAPTTELRGMTPEDPYQYAPQFLLWPKLAISLTDDYPSIRLLWFGLQVTLCMGAVLALALWVGGPAGRLAAWLAPAVLASFPVLHNFQYGQFHFAAVALAVLGVLALERGRRPLGGALLAVSILSKLFPAVLLVPLAVQRRWRDLAWVAAAGAALTVAALLAIGPAPFVAFFDYHLPRLGNGEAFAFDQVWPELRGLVIADNQGVAGLVAKLRELGVPGMTGAVTGWANRLFGVALLGLAVAVGRDLQRATRLDRAATWLALLGLGSLASAGAWGDYVPLTSIWLLSLLAVRAAEGSRAAMALGATAVLHFFILGTTPIGSLDTLGLLIPLSAVGALAMFAVFGGTLVGLVRRTGESAPRALEPAPARARVGPR